MAFLAFIPLAVLAPSQLELDVQALVKRLEYTQWTHQPDFKSVAHLPIMTREDLRKLPMQKGLYTVRTSGSTGEPVSVEKTYADYVWFLATCIRELQWKKWDVTKTVALLSPRYAEQDKETWGIPLCMAPVQGRAYLNHFLPISELQVWLEKKNPQYICLFPSMLAQLDLSKISNLIATKGTGEVGASLYSSEECGVIAIECPDNPEVMHVMENILIEESPDGIALMSSMTSPYIKRYRHGDYLEMGTCFCGRSLQTIKKVKGRIRNLWVLPNGDKKWPQLGSKYFYEKFGIKRFKGIQTAINHLEFQIISPYLGEKEKELKAFILENLQLDVEITIKYVDRFDAYKAEEFISQVAFFP